MPSFKDFWLRLSIKTKLLSYFFIVIAIISFFNLYLNNNNYTIIDQFNGTMTNYYSINRLMVFTEENKHFATKYLREKKEEDKASYLSKKAEILTLVAELETKLTSLDAYFRINAIKNALEVMYEKWDQTILEREQNISTYFNAYYEGERISLYTSRYIEDLFYISLGEGNELYKKLAEEARIMRQISIILIAFSSAFAMFIGFLFVNSFINPIKKLADTSLRISSGDLEVEEVTIASKDEVGILADSFNTMSLSIQSYVSDLKEKVIIEKRLHEEELEVIRMEQLLKASQFEALQSQINPHFLFNTLNTISRTAMFEEAEETLKLIQALSQLFRYKLRNQASVIPLKEELWMAKEYIYLQKSRFKERLTYEIIVDERSQMVSVPIFMLQPIIENAIIHGIEHKVQGGKLRIKVTSRYIDEKEIITLRITDTGVGMSKKRLEEVLSFKDISHRSIGVSNVYHRFMMMYNQQGTFKMMSKEGCGTCTEFKFERNELDGKI
ncbi:sensor histidine kinase [Cellulosilyticum sp. I15G10I2]|uniref:sensor histidine kinase n=1 Tax=Cellulosilyticum sp. I15G10I2 TaxID=1892843 RepID=UPI00085C986E|nr:histidine kinase [Cellulosilyticum sp. I15G10I2]